MLITWGCCKGWWCIGKSPGRGVRQTSVWILGPSTHSVSLDMWLCSLSLNFLCWEIAMRLPPFVGRVKVQDIHSMPDTNRHSKLALPSYTSVVAQEMEQPTSLPPASPFTGAHGNVHFYRYIYSSMGQVNKSSKACEMGHQIQYGVKGSQGCLLRAQRE